MAGTEPVWLVSVYLDALLSNFYVDAALAFLVIQVAHDEDACDEQANNQI